MRTISRPQALDSNTQPSLDIAVGPPFIQVSGYAELVIRSPARATPTKMSSITPDR